MYIDVNNPVRGTEPKTAIADILAYYLWPLLLIWFNFNPSMDK